MDYGFFFSGKIYPKKWISNLEDLADVCESK